MAQYQISNHTGLIGALGAHKPGIYSKGMNPMSTIAHSIQASKKGKIQLKEWPRKRQKEILCPR